MIIKLGTICTIDWGNTSLTKKSYQEDGKFIAVSATGCDGRINHYEHEEDVCVLSAIGAQCGKMFFPQEKGLISCIYIKIWIVCLSYKFTDVISLISNTGVIIL